MTDTDTSAEAIEGLSQILDHMALNEAPFEELRAASRKMRALSVERDALIVRVADARNAALEEAAVITEDEGRKSRNYPGETIAETYCDDAAEIIRALKTPTPNTNTDGETNDQD